MNFRKTNLTSFVLCHKDLFILWQEIRVEFQKYRAAFFVLYPSSIHLVLRWYKYRLPFNVGGSGNENLIPIWVFVFP